MSEPTVRDTIRQIVRELAGRMRHASPGDLAELRRNHDPGPAFWRLWVDVIADRWAAPSDASGLQAVEDAWRTICAALAVMSELHAESARLGSALSETGYSDLRVERLLRADGEQRATLALDAVRYLASKGKSADVADIALLLLSDDEARDRQRRNIARSYYTSQFKAEKEITP